MVSGFNDFVEPDPDWAKMLDPDPFVTGIKSIRIHNPGSPGTGATKYMYRYRIM
jgi:hypothetical protein